MPWNIPVTRYVQMFVWQYHDHEYMFIGKLPSALHFLTNTQGNNHQLLFIFLSIFPMLLVNHTFLLPYCSAVLLRQWLDSLAIRSVGQWVYDNKMSHRSSNHSLFYFQIKFYNRILARQWRKRNSRQSQHSDSVSNCALLLLFWYP